MNWRCSESRQAWCDAVCGGRRGLKLGSGGLPQSWREPDDLSYALREVARTDMASLFNYSTPLGLPALREQIVKRLKLFDIEARSTAADEHQRRQSCAGSDRAHLVQGR